MDNINKDIDFKKLSKPIKTTDDNGGWLKSVMKKILGEGEKRIHIAQRQQALSDDVTDKDMEKFNKKDDQQNNKKSKSKDEIPNFGEAKKVNSQGAEEFFIAAKEENEREDETWLKPAPPKEKTKIYSVGPNSFSWLIIGALSLLIIVVIVFASFGLVNLIRRSFENQYLNEIDQAIMQATDFYNKQEYEPAKYKIEEVLLQDSENQEANELLDKINQKRGEIILGEFMLYKESDLTLTATSTYIDNQNHFSIYQDPTWNMIDSDYDIKFTNEDATYGVKKYPGINSLKKLEEKYTQRNEDQDNKLLTTKDNISFNDNNSKVMVSENQHYYIVSVLMQKYYFGYEISGWIPKTNTANALEETKKFAKSFVLLSDFSLTSYDKLPTFSIDNNTFHYWVDRIDDENQSYISNQFINSLSLINKTLLTNWNEHLDIYLYPDFATLYTYTLSHNSFSDHNQKEIHIVYENRQSHQSFGYETAKVILQNTFGEVKEKYLIEGAAVYLDQTGRDYLEILKSNPFIPLSELSSVNWEIKQGDLKYFEVGVFAEYMIDKYGVDMYINLTQEVEFPEAYQKIYDQTLEEIEEEMKTELGLQ